MKTGKALRNLLIIIILPVAVSTALFQSGILRQDLQGFRLTVAHFNDSHAAIDEGEITLNIKGTPVTCKAGGYARLASRALELRSKNPHFLLLNAGDVFQGTPFFTRYLGMADVKLMNLMKVDAMVPGNHEFDRKSGTLARFIGAADFPVISSNIDYSNDSKLRYSTVPWKIFSFDGVKVGVMGLTLTRTREISNPSDDLVFMDVAETARRMADFFQMKGVKIIIALTHLGLMGDIELAHNVEGIDLIVGGHSHSLMGPFGDTVPGAELPYPLVMDDGYGEKTLIVQAWENSRMMGDLTLTFDAEGRITGQGGAAVLLLGHSFMKRNPDGSEIPLNEKESEKVIDTVAASDSMSFVEPDREASKIIEGLAAPVRKLQTDMLGRAENDLPHFWIPGKRDRHTGNGYRGSLVAQHVADSMAWKARSSGLAENAIAVVNTGGIRDGIRAGKISAADIITTMPFGNTLVMMELSGRRIREALSQAVRRSVSGKGAGAFPYVSGLRYSFTCGEDPEIKDIQVSEGGSWKGIEDGRNYTVITNSYLAGGGDGYRMFRDEGGNIRDTGFRDNLVFMEYIRQVKVLDIPRSFNVKLLR